MQRCGDTHRGVGGLQAHHLSRLGRVQLDGLPQPVSLSDQRAERGLEAGVDWKRQTDRVFSHISSSLTGRQLGEELTVVGQPAEVLLQTGHIAGRVRGFGTDVLGV